MVIITFFGKQSRSLLLSSELVKQLEVSIPESLQICWLKLFFMFSHLFRVLFD